ncbi:MAG: hypothetical protein ACRETN_07615 [Nevskiales bacterium]
MNSSLSAAFKPIEKWPGAPTPGTKRQRSPFKAGWLRLPESSEIDEATELARGRKKKE